METETEIEERERLLVEEWYADEIDGRDPRFNPVGIVIILTVLVAVFAFLCEFSSYAMKILQATK